MLSVNIPVYNIEVHPLVFTLAKQANALGIDYEIRVYDDGSEETMKQKNRKVADIPDVIYREMKENMGRAAIRNKMAVDSKKRYLLFIDADSKITAENYLENYLKYLPEHRVLCGGTVYSPGRPENPEKLLRWCYGSKREAISAEQRNKKKGFIITSNNFIIETQLFKQVLFRENMGPYGHEDTLLGYDLFKRGVLPVHIENPTEHTGLEDSGTFLNKTKKALENLSFISKEIIGEDKNFSRQVRFLKQYKKITAVFPVFLLRIFYSCFHRRMEIKLTGKNPRLFWFDLYKLSYFSRLSRKAS